ncbi:MAG TPA: carboxypeptidase-like regulatory domain-containing protein, partial [Chitinophagaceae bacterium]|nr:carboxypeptidase-like regulatory domain-containing protein [Chitinophagaceae bacterium]
MPLLILLSFLVVPFSLLAQQKTFTGQVTDSRKAPLPGVSVLIKGTSHGTTTDAAGQFTLKDIAPNAVLVFSSTGFQDQEISLKDKNTSINVILLESTSNLNEVVVIGYGTAQKKDLTGAVSQIKVSQL